MTRLRVVVLAASEGGVAALGPALRSNRVTADSRIAVTLITPHSAEKTPGVDVLSLPIPHQGFSERVARGLQGSMVGRNLSRFTPFDPNVRFWKMLKRCPEALAVASAADLLIAGDRNTILAAWRIARRNRARAQQGLNAGLATANRLLADS